MKCGNCRDCRQKRQKSVPNVRQSMRNATAWQPTVRSRPGNWPRRKKQDAKARLDRSVELALDAGDVTAFQREAVNIVRVFDNLSATQRNLLWEKMETMQMETLVGTSEEITAMNVLGEKIRRWKSEEKGRFEARARVFQISIDGTRVEEGFGLLDKKPENPDASNRRPRTFRENLLAIFGFRKK